MTQMNVPGACRCGAVRYRLLEEPLTFYLCHCTDCQAESGSAFGQTMHVRREAIGEVAGELTQGEVQTTSGRQLVLHECLRCRTILWAERPGAPFLGLNASTLEDVGGLTPYGNMWTRSARPWVSFAPGPRYEQHPPDPLDMARAWAKRHDDG